MTSSPDAGPTDGPDRALLATWADALLTPANAVVATQLDAIAAAGRAIAGRLATGGRLLTFGAGHSWAIAAELCSRAGGLPGVIAMNLADLDTSPRPAHTQLEDSNPERLAANGERLARLYAIAPTDALLIASNSGRNGAPVELARLARDRGTVVVAIISRAHCAAVASRHPQNLKLPDVADLTIDNHGPVGDAAIAMASGDRMGGTSTIAGALIAQLLALSIATTLADAGAPLTALRSANLGT